MFKFNLFLIYLLDLPEFKDLFHALKNELTGLVVFIFSVEAAFASHNAHTIGFLPEPGAD
jgi:hypothetical protein